MADRLDRMSKAELIEELRQLGAGRDRHTELEAVVHELRVHQEKVQLQRDQLIAAQQELEESRDRYADLFEYAPTGYIALDRGGIIREANFTAAELFGRERARIVGRPLVVLIADRDRLRLLDHVRQCRSGETPVVTEVHLRCGDDGERPIQLSTRVVRSIPGDAEFRTALIDLSERYAMAAALAERERLVVEEQRARAANAEKDRFLAMLSHELRTPLTPVLATVAMLVRDRELPQAVRDALAMIHRNIDLETRLIEDLLDVTRISRGKFELSLEVVDVHEALWHAVETCGRELEDAGAALAVDLAAPAHHVRGDPTRLRQVFWNLLRNAVKAMPGGGRVEVRTANDGPGSVTITVVDTGVGIEPADLERIFLPFNQGHDPGRSSGLGLGLAICRAIVDAHGGRIRVVSEGTGRGARFEVELETVQPATVVAHAPAAALSSALEASGKTVLLVEDHPDTANALSDVLRLEGFAVRVAHTVEQALAELEAGCDVMVSDIALPDASGLDLMRQARDRGAVPGIALSGFGSADDLRRSREAGFAVHLVKPVEMDELIRNIRELTQRRGPRAAYAGARPNDL